MFMLCIAQVGAVAGAVPAVIWVYWSGEPGWGNFLLVWRWSSHAGQRPAPGAHPHGRRPAAAADLRRRHRRLLAFGLVGIFVGPVILAVGYTLLEAWIDDGLGKA